MHGDFAFVGRAVDRQSSHWWIPLGQTLLPPYTDCPEAGIMNYHLLTFAVSLSRPFLLYDIDIPLVW